MNYSFLATSLVLGLLGGFASVVSQDRPFTPTDLVSMKRPGGFKPSADGSQILYSSSTYDPATNKKTSKYYLLDVGSGKSSDVTNITTTDFSDPTWIDKNRVAFLSSRNGSPNLFSIDVKSGASSLIQHTNFTFTDVNGPKIDLKSKKLIFSTGVPIVKKEKTFSSALVYDELYVRHWDTWYDYVHQHVHVADLIEGKITTKAKDLLSENPKLESPRRPDYDSSEYVLSPDGKTVAFLTRPASKDQAWKTTTHLYLVPTEGKPTLELISEKNLGAISNPLFSPDGKYLAWSQMLDLQNESEKNLITILDLKTKAKRVLNKEWDASPTSFKFSNDGKSLYVTSHDDGSHKLYSLNIATGARSEIVKKGTNSLLGEFKDNLLITNANSRSPAEVYSVKKDGSNLKAVSSINTAFLEKFKFKEYEPFYFTGALNEKVQGFLIKPPNFDPKKKYPVMFWVHGGPESPFNDNWSNRWNYQITPNAGYVLVSVNFHGTPGWGNNFTKSILQNWGSHPFEDLMKGLDYALKKYSFLDGDRTVAWGASYGGFMINFINGHTNRFKALVCHDGTFDTRHAYYTTEELYFMENEFGGTPWEQPEKVDKFSPAKFVKNWKTPALIIHGAKDFRLVDGEGLAAFTALQRQGIPSKFVYFPDENHWVQKNANSLRWMHENLAWSAKWVNHTTPYAL